MLTTSTTGSNPIIELEVGDVIETSLQNIKKNKIKSLKDVYSKSPVIKFSKELEIKNRELKDFLNQNLYQYYKVIKMQEKSKRIIEALFSIYIRETNQLPPQFRKTIPEFGKERVICDYIAGMTDRFAQYEYERLFLPFQKM
jgi:dGTPase